MFFEYFLKNRYKYSIILQKCMRTLQEIKAYNTMRYIDMHCHTSLKSYLGSETEVKRPDCWQIIKDTSSKEIVNNCIGDCLTPQCTLTQIHNSNGHVVFDALYAIERPIITGEIREFKNDVINLLLASRLIKSLSHKLLSWLLSNHIGYYDIVGTLRNHLMNSREISHTYNLISSYDDINPDLLNIGLSIEGAHAFFDDTEVFEECDVLNRLAFTKKQEIQFLYITLVHLTINPLSCHSFGMNLMKGEKFIPNGNGISEFGRDFIKQALDRTKGQRILIDVKHMSLKARLEYYQIVKENIDEIPIIASHIGVTGISYKQMPVLEYSKAPGKPGWKIFLEKPSGLMNTEFNPCSINFYDEEIKIIIDSNGIMGINLDQNILGAKNVLDPEYFSEQEIEYYKPFFKYPTNKKSSNLNESEPIDEISESEKHLKHICNNILHIIKIGGKKAWDHICLGTDFDGLINSIDCCKSADQIVSLNDILGEMIVKMAESDMYNDYYITNVVDNVEKILYKNADRFLKQYFNESFRSQKNEINHVNHKETLTLINNLD